MAGNVYRTANGKLLDMRALVLKNETVRAVGNMNVNARGDLIDDKNQVIKPQLDAFVRGFREPININAIGLKNKSIKILNKLIVGETNINRKQLINMIVLQGFNSEDEKNFMKSIIEFNCVKSIMDAWDEAELKFKPDTSKEDKQKILINKRSFEIEKEITPIKDIISLIS